MRRVLLVLSFAALLAACAAPSGNLMPQSWMEDPDNAELAIYRTRSLVAGARNTYFYVDGVHVATLGSSTYTVVKVPPGSHRLTQKWDWDMMVKDMNIEFSTAPKEKRYVRLAQSGSNTIYSSPTVIQFGWELSVVPEGIAQGELRSLEPRRAIGSARR